MIRLAREYGESEFLQQPVAKMDEMLLHDDLIFLIAMGC
jgi:hypothetical protein